VHVTFNRHQKFRGLQKKNKKRKENVVLFLLYISRESKKANREYIL